MDETMNDWRDHYPRAMTQTDLFERFEEIAAQVNNDGHLAVIESKSGEVVLLPASEYRSIMETLHVLSSPAQHRRVVDALNDARNGQSVSGRFDGNAGLFVLDQ